MGTRRDMWLVVDECSQVLLYCWNALAALKLVDWNFVIAGDFEGQLPPVIDRWSKADSIGDGVLIRTLTNGPRARLTTNRRCREDLGHFEWYTGPVRPPRHGKCGEPGGRGQ